MVFIESYFRLACRTGIKHRIGMITHNIDSILFHAIISLTLDPSRIRSGWQTWLLVDAIQLKYCHSEPGWKPGEESSICDRSIILLSRSFAFTLRMTNKTGRSLTKNRPSYNNVVRLLYKGRLCIFESRFHPRSFCFIKQKTLYNIHLFFPLAKDGLY